MLDRFNRNITYLRISITDRCNLRCKYCVPDGCTIPQTKKKLLSYEEIIAFTEAAAEIGIRKIRLTGGEPLLRKEVVKLVRGIKMNPAIEELTMTTNGILLTDMAESLKEAGLDRINISIDTLDPEKYREMTRGGDINKVLTAIDRINALGYRNTKINTVVMPEFNGDEIPIIEQFCRSKGIRFQRINHYSLSDINSIDTRYDAERPLSCRLCNRIRLTSDGKIKPCLFSNIEIPINMDNIKESLVAAIQGKPVNGSQNTSRGNWQIGG